MRPVLLSIAALTLPFALIQSCASQASSGTAASSSVRNRNILMREEIQRGEYQTAYDAVLALRRTWLIQRAQDGLVRDDVSPTRVYLDEMRLGGLEDLRTIATARVAQINYFDGPSAYARWGQGHDRGVVQVITIAPQPARP